jgi:hypothetical protein
LPGLIDLYEAHKNDRNKFEILAFHDGTVKDFAELDKKLETPRTKFWGGHDLPFPILLDATGQTIKDWGVRAFPTTLLIDPEGKLVGEAGEQQLEEKLPPLPMSVRLAKALDRNIAVGVQEIELEKACNFLSLRAHVPIRVDKDDLRAAGVKSDTKVPLSLSGMLSLRSWLNLLLEADNLTYDQDDKGLVIRRRKLGAPPRELSVMQRTCAQRIEKMLDSKIQFEFKDKPLSEVAQFFENKTQENFVLSPSDRRASLIDPKMLVTGSAKDQPLREALKKLLDPSGVTFIIRDEVVVLTAKPKATSAK